METANTYNYTVVRQFAVMTVVWGIVGVAAGVFIAAQLVWPCLLYTSPSPRDGLLSRMPSSA